MSEQQQSVIVPVDLFNAITNYLTSRPYNEVHSLINELRQAVKIVEMPEEESAESSSDE